jgi:toxin ParE1/3/4
MAKYSLTKKAIEDLSQIWEYTYDFWSEIQADKYYFELLRDCKELSEYPNLGKNYKEINVKSKTLSAETLLRFPNIHSY